MEFKDLLDRYMEYLEDGMVPKTDFVVGGQTLIKYDDLYRLFKRDCQYLPLLKRHKEMEKKLMKRVRNLAERAIEAKLQETEQHLISLRMQGSLTPELAHSIYNDRDSFMAHVEEETKSGVKAYMKLWMGDSVLNLYLRLLGDREMMKKLADPSIPAEVLDLVVSHAQERLISSNKVTEDDLAGLAYLEGTIGTRKEPERFDLIVVDEGQDLSEFQYYMLRRAARSGSFTIAGDLNQAIHAKGLNRWEMLEKSVFGDMKVRYQTIRKSYRTTVEIMNLANTVISRLGSQAELADPVLRHGQEPEYIVSKSKDEILRTIVQNLPQVMADEYASAGIICRNVTEAKEVYKALSSKMPKEIKSRLSLLTDTETEYKAGISVLPAFLCKGLEFDVTVVFDASQYSLNPQEIRLFYVTITRALHRLFIYSVGPAPGMEK
jgi:DNA helicase-2/ATP-dependent DNA helicase PcrA